MEFHELFTPPPYTKGMYQGALTGKKLPIKGDWSSMREMRWTDLVTRLAAVTDERGTMVPDGSRRSKGRFVSLSQDAGQDGYLGVNHELSTDRKEASGSEDGGVGSASMKSTG